MTSQSSYPQMAPKRSQNSTGLVNIMWIKEEESMWAYESVFYQIYPLGFCGAPFENDGVLEHRILKVVDWMMGICRGSPLPGAYPP